MRTRLIVSVVCLVVLAGGVGWWLWPSQRTSLLLITLDTTRADRIGCYGYQPAVTPVLDRLAAGGVLFENAYVCCPVTLPSHTTMFTGLTPREHGVHHNGLGKLDAQIPTLAEMLHAQEYQTGAFIGAFVLNRKFGLDRGFQKYDDDTGAEILNNQVHRRRSAKLVVDDALAWLKGRTSRPFFCWVHLFDPHAPYRSRKEDFGAQFDSRPYDAGIAFADQQIARIINFLDEQHLLNKTLIVVVGDHGEGLNEHDEREHGHMLYNSTLRVPLIFAHPSLCKPGHRVAQPVSLADLMPTLQDALGVKQDKTLSSRSLATALRGQTLTPRECYAETDIPYLEHRWAPQRSLVTERWKYIRSPRPEIYDLIQDPAEQHNLADSQPEILQELETSLTKLESGLHDRLAQNVKLSSAELRALASLGYVGNPANRKEGHADHDRKSLPDVKDRLKYHDAVEDANQMLNENRPQKALEILETVTASVPDYFPARMFLGEALAKLGRLDEALKVFQKLSESDPQRAEVHARLGSILNQLGRRDEAQAELDRALDLAPDTAEFRVSLGSLFLEMKQQEKALNQFRSAVQLDPACANFEIGKILVSAGDLKGAVERYRRTLECDPNWLHLNGELAVLLARQRRLDEAIPYAARAVQVDPQNADAHYNLGVMLFQQGKFQAAVGPLEAALRLNPQHPKAPRQLERARKALGGQD